MDPPVKPEGDNVEIDWHTALTPRALVIAGLDPVINASAAQALGLPNLFRVSQF